MTIVFKISDNIKPKMIKYYDVLKRDKTPPYAIFQAEESGTIITLYESGKVMFQGISADIDARIWIDLEKKYNNRIIDIKTGKDIASIKQKDTDNLNNYSTIGSDEVGCGDYFGPIVVCAAFVGVLDHEFLNELKVMDSKKINDDRIKEIAPIIMKRIPYSAYILSNEEYNNLDHSKVNLNKIKALLHNKVLFNLVNKDLKYEKIVVDEFTPSKNYYSYLSDTSNVVKNITFTQKAEDKCLSVACASIISRYIFLREMYKLSEEVGKVIPLGAGSNVDLFARELVTKKGMDILNKYVKLNFKNTQKIKIA